MVRPAWPGPGRASAHPRRPPRRPGQGGRRAPRRRAAKVRDGRERGPRSIILRTVSTDEAVALAPPRLVPPGLPTHPQDAEAEHRRRRGGAVGGVDCPHLDQVAADAETVPETGAADPQSGPVDLAVEGQPVLVGGEAEAADDGRPAGPLERRRVAGDPDFRPRPFGTRPGGGLVGRLSWRRGRRFGRSPRAGVACVSSTEAGVTTAAPTTVLAGSSTGEPPNRAIAASAFSSPAPTAAGAVHDGEFRRRGFELRLDRARRRPAAEVWRIRAAIAAACGAASEVPQKCQPSAARPAKKVVEAQSVAVTFGFCSTSALASFAAGVGSRR